MIRYVLNLLTDMRTQAERAYSRDLRFRGLCDDYAEAIEACELWKASHVPNAGQRVEEYSALVASLEDEILAEIRNL
jgi:hypothetical protein